MTETSNRTFVCCVLFLDIVEYSKMAVTEQLSLKQRFNELLVSALKHVVANDRIVLDTGDGAAVSFLGNPEDSLFAAMSLRDALAAQDPKQTPPLNVRIGLNLGPVRLVKDINGQLNIIGDGINVAQRVMSFAEPGSIMVSRSYFEVVARLSPDYERIFQYDGTRTDKHVREHAVYVIGPVGGSGEAAAEGEAIPVPASEALAKAPAGKSNKRVIAAVAIAIAIVGAAVALRMARTKDAFEPVEQQSTTAAADKADKVDKADKKVAAESSAAPAPTAPAAPKAPSKISVSLAIAPWGEVYVDGQMKGVSPPLKALSLTPGKHKIEIRNTTFPSHTVQIDESVKDKIMIQHKF
ncbi:MAG TPA: adenylate/guanylate cyclase domain-containing protein [Rhodocyclaceae bacterium]|nr:adenylate/guanylate cyclase domain-containing protein [Rhodocyclaceae bacterium]